MGHPAFVPGKASWSYLSQLAGMTKFRVAHGIERFAGRNCKSSGGASPVFFGPGTLWRTWGTRPVSIGFRGECWLLNLADVNAVGWQLDRGERVGLGAAGGYQEGL
jgi:hypothetical protein